MAGRHGLGTIIPIPGAEKEEWVRENCASIILTDEEMLEIEEILKKNSTLGDQYMGPFSKLSEI
jgi:diketogulonate reductase-like aldo/keto reductase